MGHVRNKSLRKRRGSIYVVTMSTGLIVAVLATTALITARVQRLERLDAHALRQSQLYAESALEMAQYRMRTSSDWRSQLVSNAWSADQSIADGFLSFTGSDPTDNDLTDSNYEPVAIVATGKKGSCVHKLKGTFEFTQPGINCLGSGVHAKENLIVDNATFNNYQSPSSSNVEILATNDGKIYSNCESAGDANTSNGGQIIGTTLMNQAAKQMPTGSNILNDYITNGTTLSIGSLPLWEFNHLVNPGAEGSTANWTANNCSMNHVTSHFHSGLGAFQISGRNIVPLTFPSYIYQNVASNIELGVDYYLESWVYVPSSALVLDSFRIKLQINATGGNVSYTTPWVAGVFDSWIAVSGIGNITWNGTLQSAYWFVESQTFAAPYYLDDCVMKEANTHALHAALLTPQSNSITGITNSQGIYVLDCQGQSVNIRNTRIAGTLVLRDPGLNSRIEGSINWEPAVSLSTNPDDPNRLAFITEKKVKIALSAANLDEGLANQNFNPAGSPYQGNSDNDLTDVYPSTINGIIYSLDDLWFGGTTTVNGVVISDKKLQVRGNNPLTTSLTINFNGVYRYVNPPLQFRDAPIYVLRSGSISRLVD